MSNFEKASNLASEWVESMGGLEAVRHDYRSDLSGLIQALDDAGLLAPDLPEVNESAPVHWIPEWRKHMEQGAEEERLDGTNVFLDRSNQKIIALAKGSHIDHYGVGEAKAVALALLAACEYAEEEQDNE